MVDTHPRVLALGAHVLDTIVHPVDSIPDGQGSLLVEEIKISPAGAAGGTAVVLAKLGARVQSVGAVGSDVSGALLKQLLSGHGVDVTHLRETELPTSASVLPIRSDGSRPALHVVGANALAADDVPWDAVAAADHVHVGAPELLGPENVIEVLKHARAHGATTSLDFLIGGDPAFAPLILPLLAFTDYVLPNAEQAIGWTEAATLHDAARTLGATGAGCVAITNGGDDIVVFEDGAVSQVPVFPAAELVDTSGGGDSFSAGFILAKLRGQSSLEAAEFGSAAAAQVVAGVGTDHGEYTEESITVLVSEARR